MTVLVETRVFTNRIRAAISDEDYRLLQLALVARPDAGAVISGTGGLRKLRWTLPGRGKRGAIRLIYFWHPTTERILLLFVHKKNERSDLTPDQKKRLRDIVAAEYR
jgi:mRNA-degrading endonuclease RelE of RelBE toxin-antitoxin system